MHVRGFNLQLSGWRLAVALVLGVIVLCGVLILGTFLVVGAVVASLIASGIYALKRGFSKTENLAGYVSQPASSTVLTTRSIEINEVLPRER